MGNGNGVRLPFRLADFLSGAYYALSITVVMVGLVAWTVHQQGRIDYLEQREKDHPTKSELAETAIRIDNRIAGLEGGQKDVARRLDDLDARGTRALGDRVNQVEQGNRSQDERIQDMVRRMNEMQAEANKISHEIPIVVERQNRVLKDAQASSERIDRVVQALDATYSRLNDFIDAYNRAKGGGERGPAAPPSWNAPPHNKPRFKEGNDSDK